jgi:hypothetical protein
VRQASDERIPPSYDQHPSKTSRSVGRTACPHLAGPCHEATMTQEELR